MLPPFSSKQRVFPKICVERYFLEVELAKWQKVRKYWVYQTCPKYIDKNNKILYSLLFLTEQEKKQKNSLRNLTHAMNPVRSCPLMARIAPSKVPSFIAFPFAQSS